MNLLILCIASQSMTTITETSRQRHITHFVNKSDFNSSSAVESRALHVSSGAGEISLCCCHVGRRYESLASSTWRQNSQMQGARCSWRELLDSLLNTELKAVAHNLEIRVSIYRRQKIGCRPFKLCSEWLFPSRRGYSQFHVLWTGCFYSDQRVLIQPFALCLMSVTRTHPVQTALVVTYLQFPIQVCFPCTGQPVTETASVTSTTLCF